MAAALLLFFFLFNPAIYSKEMRKSDLKTFNSYSELKDFLLSNREFMRKFSMFSYGSPILTGSRKENISMPSLQISEESAGDSASPEFSTTNNQVDGVEEGDLVQCDGDGKYLYVANSRGISIIYAYPAEKAKVVSKISFAAEAIPNEIYLNKNKLAVILGNRQSQSGVMIEVFDISDHEKPILKREIAFKGNYLNSRMIGDYVYTIANTPAIEYEPGTGKEQIRLPEISLNGENDTINANDVHYFDYPDYYDQYTLIMSFNILNDNEAAASETFLSGASQDIYSSQENIYLLSPKIPDLQNYVQKIINGLEEALPYNVARQFDGLSTLSPAKKIGGLENIINENLSNFSDEQVTALEQKMNSLFEELNNNINRENRKTVIRRFFIKDGRITYNSQGEIPGYVLNQFSMDEYKGFFRIATTSQRFVFGEPLSTSNNIYILDQGMKIAGRLEGLAPSENIYSVRYIGTKAYLVTYRQIDPLFTVDLKDPYNPKLLGELKIPGYSDYLHPLDENHLIGIGKESSMPQPIPIDEPLGEQIRTMPVLPRTGGPYLKIGLFDVSDPANPKEISKYIVDQEGSDSLALRDHHAFLFSRSKNLLFLPVSYYQERVQTKNGFWENNLGGAWQGAYVFGISLKNGISLKGRVNHSEEKAVEEQYPYYENGIKRSLYINDVLYTVSEHMLKASSLENLKVIKEIDLDV
ncbi:MAG: Beta propeller domain-containing protein [Parcubacteria bacterium 33_209]|nr:MAG: Beta propeller domain-containing protein [Parcubacteria bacterium 33_209]